MMFARLTPPGLERYRGNAEVSPTSAVSTESLSLYAEMHAAIPAAARDNVLEYH